MAGGERMSPNLISRQVEDYIAYKQALGYQIKIESQELRRFAAYTESIEHTGSLTVEVAFQWAALKPEYTLVYGQADGDRSNVCQIHLRLGSVSTTSSERDVRPLSWANHPLYFFR
jgi:hypothetical protein